MRARRRLPEPEAARLLQQLLAALACCHARDVVHRDVKLENVLLDGGGDARLIDFGLCGYYAAGKRLRWVPHFVDTARCMGLGLVLCGYGMACCGQYAAWGRVLL